ncbi:MAG: hypothetical protein JWP03_2479 [Phycisphaerales bacterium]|nr:hypothetical protein [Phycisphaerales bacterium]
MHFTTNHLADGFQRLGGPIALKYMHLLQEKRNEALKFGALYRAEFEGEACPILAG